MALDQGPRDFRRGNGEHDADRLRRRERQVERRDLRLTRARAKPAIWGSRVAALKQSGELARTDPAVETQLAGTGADPLTGCLATARVVVVAALRDLLRVVGLLPQGQLPDRQH
jgi:hypothetical protein